MLDGALFSDDTLTMARALRGLEVEVVGPLVSRPSGELTLDVMRAEEADGLRGELRRSARRAGPIRALV